MTDQLRAAVYDNKIEDVKLLIASGCSVNCLIGDWSPTTPLIAAAENGFYEMMECLLLAGADPNGRCPHRYTALMIASIYDRPACVKLLLMWNADPNLQDISGRTALTDAAQGKSLESVELLLSVGAKINHQDHFGVSALFTASLYGNEQMIEVLVKAGANPRLPDQWGKTALDWLAEKPHLRSLVVNYPKFQVFSTIATYLPRDLHTFIYPFVIS